MNEKQIELMRLIQKIQSEEQLRMVLDELAKIESGEVEPE